MVRGKKRPRQTSRLFAFDLPYLERYQILAGVDEAGRGPLAGPVVAAAIILPAAFRLRGLNDSKQIPPPERQRLYRFLQRSALAIGVGIVSHEEIDRINIRQASFQAMRLALAQLPLHPRHVLIDGFCIPEGPASQTGIVDGDAQSAHIAAASIIAKVTRDCIMTFWHRRYPHYGFHQHKGYGTPAHLAALRRHGPCALHRRSFAPVEQSLLS